jgi:Electron transfer DM13
MRRLILLLTTHLLTLGAGFGLGVYFLPILTAPDDPPVQKVQAAMEQARYHATLHRDQKGSDALHWADGTLSISSTAVAFTGKIAPGPDYKVYLTREFVDTKAGFERIKADAVRIGEVKTFNRFVVDVPTGVDVEEFTTVVVWCERFAQFISAGQYRTPG